MKKYFCFILSILLTATQPLPLKADPNLLPPPPREFNVQLLLTMTNQVVSNKSSIEISLETTNASTNLIKVLSTRYPDDFYADLIYTNGRRYSLITRELTKSGFVKEIPPNGFDLRKIPLLIEVSNVPGNYLLVAHRVIWVGKDKYYKLNSNTIKVKIK